MTKCGCCHRRASSKKLGYVPTVNEPEGANSPPLIYGPKPATVLVAPDTSDVLAQTIEVTQEALEKRQSSLRRILSQRHVSEEKVGENVVNAALADTLVGEQNLLDAKNSVDSLMMTIDNEGSLAQTETQIKKSVSMESKVTPDVVEKSVSIKVEKESISDVERTRELEPVHDFPSLGTVSQRVADLDAHEDVAEPRSSHERDESSADLPQESKSQAITNPADLLHAARRKFLREWFEILRSCQKDVELWEMKECLLKSHILSRLVRIDCERAHAVLEGGDTVLTEIAPSSSCILPVDGNLPFLESLMPAEVIAEIGGAADIIADFRQNSTDVELDAIKELVHDLVDRSNNLQTQYLDDKWNNFGEVMSTFDLNERVSFDLGPLSLMSDTTVSLWLESIRAYGATSVADQLRIQTAPTTAPRIDCKKRGFRRSLSRGVRKMGRKIKYRKQNASNRSSEEPWVSDEKPQLSLAYRLHADGNVSVKVRCKLPVNFINMLIVLDDIQGFKTWLPYCTDVHLYKKYGTASYLLSYIAEMPWPIKKRETLAFCEGVDALDEMGELIVVVRNPPLSAGQDTIFGDAMPPPDPKIPRIPKCALVFFVRPLASEETAVELFARLDPGMNVKLLKGVIPWIVKNTVVDFMVKIANLAHLVKVDEILNEPDREFYRTIRERGDDYIAHNSRMSADITPALTEKQRRAIGFDDKDDKWYEKLPLLKL